MCKHKLNAVIIKSNRVISTGENKVKNNITHNISRKTRELWNMNQCAEKNAILKALKLQDGLRHLAGATIYVTRYNNQGETRLAKPCKFCRELIVSVGIKKIVYTNSNNSTTTEKS